MSWARMRRRAADLVAANRVSDRFDAVFVDEVQDLQPNALRMLVGVCRSPDRMMLTADANQSIYGSGFSWTEVHGDLRFQGRTGILRKNYRSTREISDAAEAYLRDAGLEPERATTSHVATGPVPAVRVVPRQAQVPMLVQYIRQATRDMRLGHGSCAVLVPTEEAGTMIAQGLTGAGIEARFMKGTTLDLRSQDVKVITHRSAKGLEFPIVAVAGFHSLKVPDAAAEERAERVAMEQRALYVAMTRAMRTLLVLAPDSDSANLFTGLDEPLWNCGTDSAA
jgi:superfamily I DNA/RNA helicase